MKSLAELKRRIKLGTKIKKIKGCTDKGIGIIRVVNKVQTNGFYMDGSWLDYPLKANLCEYENNTFSFYYCKDGHEYKNGAYRPKTDVKGDLIGKYEIIEY